MADSESAEKLPGLVFTFYSYKGGVGRSMALANVGVLMATEGHRVLLVDWDLEAPGLELYFKNAARLIGDAATTPGIVDLLEGQASKRTLPWRDCVLKAEFFGHSLDILTAGSRSDDYRRRVQQLDWATLFSEHRIGNYINTLREEWRVEYDFVLVDSRTGITDIGDICTVILPDVLVLLFVTNHQNIRGIKDAMTRAVHARSKMPVNRSKLLGVPVPSRDERDREYEKSIEWQGIFADEFGELYREWLPKDIRPADALNRLFIPYVAKWSFGERIPVIESERERADPTSLGAAYARLTALLTHRLDWDAVEGKASAADVVGARVELSKARSAAEEAERRLELERAAARAQLEKVRQGASRWRRVLTWAMALLLMAAGGVTYRWRLANPSATVIAERLKDPDPAARATAARALGFKEGDADPFASAIADLLRDSDASVREASASALGQMAVLGSAEVVSKFAPEVAVLLKDDSGSARRAAACTLVWMDQAPRFLPDIAALLEDEDALQCALFALQRAGPEGARFAPRVAESLKHKDAYYRQEAIVTLAAFGTAGEEFAPDIAELLADPDSRVRAAAEDALRKMGTAGASFLVKKQ